jgi:light-regulated signal transduction histidine kinase (bacteriophytochrome)
VNPSEDATERCGRLEERLRVLSDATRAFADATIGVGGEVVLQDHLYAQVDFRLARALVQNLLGNAWKFTCKVASARIEFGATAKDGDLIFFVCDNGAGFDMAFASKLFVPFQRLHTVDESPGTGLGLATVQRIVRRHGGRVWAEGSVDSGATFYFTFSPPALGATP